MIKVSQATKVSQGPLAVMAVMVLKVIKDRLDQMVPLGNLENQGLMDLRGIRVKVVRMEKMVYLVDQARKVL